MFTESDSPGEAILRLAKEKSADHIVMGSRGRDPISRTLSGSISYFCTHHSDVPISVVPPPSPGSPETSWSLKYGRRMRTYDAIIQRPQRALRDKYNGLYLIDISGFLDLVGIKN